MINLIDIVTDDLKQAMREKNQFRMDTIRAVKSAFVTFEKSNPGVSWSDANYATAIRPLIKQRNDSRVQYEKAGNLELANNELAELIIIQVYLNMVQPQQLTEDEMREITHKLMAEQSLDKSCIGKVMAHFKTNYDGQYDGKALSVIFRELAK